MQPGLTHGWFAAFCHTQLNNRRGMGVSCNNIGNIYFMIEQYDEAKK